MSADNLVDTPIPHNVEACIQYGADQFRQAQLFFGHGTDNAEDEALWLVFYALSIDFDSDERVFQQSVDKTQWQTINTLFTRRIRERVPAAYLTGEAWFCGVPFIVNEHVLVPRSPIAELITHQFSPWCVDPPARVLDLCAGCGCIGIATALSLPKAQVDLADISHQALQVAQQNIERHQLQERVSAIHSDVFAAIKTQCYDLIVTNPPYVDAIDLASMPDEYHAEPAMGLGSGEDGLDITRQLLQQAANYLTPEGVMIVEVGNSWVNLESAFPKVPFMWVEFASGGHGVFVITRDQLVQYQAEFL